MLVLSRGRDEKIVFPNVGITVQILRIVGNRVRVGIEAPPQIKVLRHEIVSPSDLEVERPESTSSGKHTHELRNRLNTATLALHLSQKQLQAGLAVEAEGTLQKALQEFESLEQLLARAKQRESVPPVKRRALLVEDNPNESSLLAGYLQMSGYVVDTVEDGMAAIRYLSERAIPDVILLDMRMPRLSGPQTVSSIRCDPKLKGLRLFAVSGTDRSTADVSIGPKGVDHWFSKPVNPQMLVEEIDRSFRRPRVLI